MDRILTWNHKYIDVVYWFRIHKIMLHVKLVQWIEAIINTTHRYLVKGGCVVGSRNRSIRVPKENEVQCCSVRH